MPPAVEFEGTTTYADSSSLPLCGAAGRTWGTKDLVCWLAAHEMGSVLCWEPRGSANW